MTQTIYVLTTEGSYSDYHIIGVYSTKESAEKVKFFYPYSKIEEYPLDNVPYYPPGMKAWRVDIRNGELWCSKQTSPDYGVLSENSYVGFWGDNYYTAHCWAVDEEHAQKIALDKYYQHQAQQAGIA